MATMTAILDFIKDHLQVSNNGEDYIKFCSGKQDFKDRPNISFQSD